MNQNENTFERRRGRCYFLRCAVAFCLLIGWAEKGFASDGARGLPFRVRQWSIENGLPLDRISCLEQTRDGYLWIGTWVGLARFDGVKFTVFQQGNKDGRNPGLKDDCINALMEDADGTLWIATKRGIILHRDGKFENLKAPADLREEKVWALRPAQGGGVWFCTDNLVVRYHDGNFATAKLPTNAGSRLSMVESADGRLNLFYKQSWFTVAPDRMKLETNHLGEANDKAYRTVLFDGDDRFWAGTAGGLMIYDGHRQYPPANPILATNAVNFLYRSVDGVHWAAVERMGLFREEGKDFAPVDLVKRKAGPSVLCMEEDYEGNLWVGTDGGLFQLQRPVVRTFTSEDGLSSDNVVSVCEDWDGTIWAATDYGVSTIRNGIAESLGSIEPSLRNHSRSVWPKRDGNIWLGKQHGLLFHFSNGRFSEDSTNAFDVPATPDALYEDRSGRLWVGSRVGAVAFEAGRFDHPVISTAENGVKEVCAILEDQAGTMWFGTKHEGLVSLRNGKYSRFTTLDGLGGDRVWNIYQDAAGALWIGTSVGLTRYHNGKFFAFTLAHGLREEPVNCVLEDNDGYFWLSGLKGIYRITRADLEAVASGRKSTIQSITIGTVDGMESAETNGERQPSGWKAHDGLLWFPTTRGLAVIDPQQVGRHIPEVRVVIEGVKADDRVVFNNASMLGDLEVISGPSPAKISAGSGHVIEFTYTANSFSKPEKTLFRYRLSGVDSEWHDQIRERTIRYLNLRPGRYQFEVSARNRHGQWSEKPAAFPFTLDPHFWQTWPFYAVCVAGIFGMAGSVHWYRLRWQRRLLKIDEQRALANERARIARDLHDDLGTALTGLALELDVADTGEHRGEPATHRLTAAAQHARGLAQRMREVVWAINPRCDNASSLSDFLEELITQFLSNAGIQIRLDFPDNIPTLPIDAETRHQAALCVREALNNIVRHARATQVNVRLRFSDGVVRLSIKDNGCGFDPTQASGNGLHNIRVRLEKMKGTFACISVPGDGTEVHFTVPISKVPKNPESRSR